MNKLNSIIYNERKVTPGSRRAHEILEKTYFYQTDCYSHCPYSWSEEVLLLLKEIDKKYGIKLNTTRVDGVVPKKNSFAWFRIRVINRVLNFILNKKVELYQVKEKYGTLRVYYSCSKHQPDIDLIIEKYEERLAQKGVCAKYEKVSF